MNMMDYIKDTYNSDYAEEYEKILREVSGGNKTINESTMQEFLEKHTAFIPTPFLLNHQLHFNTFISKFPIGPWVTDFAYLTKSSVEWYVVLVEIENPHKKIFKGSIEHAAFSAEYAQAKQQLMDWKVYIDDNKREVLGSLRRIRRPLEHNKVSFKYVLLMGRREEIQNSEARRRAIAEVNSNEIKIITYDTLLSDYRRVRRMPDESLVLNLYNIDRFKCKYIPENLQLSGLFGHMSCEDIQFTEDQIKLLKRDDYEMDSWLKGEYLVINEKHTQKGYAERLPVNSSIRKVFEKK